jgi:hypothetical protein
MISSPAGAAGCSGSDGSSGSSGSASGASAGSSCFTSSVGSGVDGLQAAKNMDAINNMDSRRETFLSIEFFSL